MPKLSTPALLLMMVRFLEPRRFKAAIRFSGMPQSPKPPIMIVAPSGTTATASSAVASTLSIGYVGWRRCPPTNVQSNRSIVPRVIRLAIPQARTPACALFEPGGGDGRGQIIANLLQIGDEGIEREFDVAGVALQDLGPHRGGTRRQTGRVRQAGAGQAEAGFAGPLTGDAHQAAGGDLRQMADVGHDAIMLIGVELRW